MNLANCRACGGEAQRAVGEYISCSTSGCLVTGPSNDPTGSKWNALMAQPAPGLSDEELLARFAAAIAGGRAADPEHQFRPEMWMRSARALLAEFREAQP